MARPLRVEFPDACYHIICRGNFRFPVFEDEDDRTLLFDRLVKFADLFAVGIRAYCTMVNHFHGYVQTSEANLGRFMQSFLTSFTVSYNRRHRTSGHVFQGRYKAFLVEDTTRYASEVSRYIHLNPVRIASLEGATVEIRQRTIRESLWSSYGATVGLRRCPRWLKRSDVLRGWGKTLRERQSAYACFVEQGLTEDLWDPWEAAAAQAIIGTDNFVDRIRRGLTELDETLSIRCERSQQRKLQAWCRLEEVIAAVGGFYGAAGEDLLVRHSRGHEARQVLLYLAAIHCRGRYTLSELASGLGPVTVGAVSHARERIGRSLSTSPELAARVAAIEKAFLGAQGHNFKD